MSKTIKAWWFSKGDKRLAHGDGRLARVGVTHSMPYPEWVEACEYGLHASVYIQDAATYAPDWETGHLFRVVLSGKMDKEHDKIAAEHRKYIGCVSMKVIREIASDIAQKSGGKEKRTNFLQHITTRYLPISCKMRQLIAEIDAKGLSHVLERRILQRMKLVK